MCISPSQQQPPQSTVSVDEFLKRVRGLYPTTEVPNATPKNGPTQIKGPQLANPIGHLETPEGGGAFFPGPVFPPSAGLPPIYSSRDTDARLKFLLMQQKESADKQVQKEFGISQDAIDQMRKTLKSKFEQ